MEARLAHMRIKRRDLAPPPEFGGDPVVWAAWLYYEDRLTQEEVADSVGVSRATVVNLLHEARERGVVTISVATGHLQSVRLAREVARRHGLETCVIAPDDGGPANHYQRIARVGARFLAETIGPDDVLGVSWGRAVLALSAALPALRLPRAVVVQIVGSAIGSADFSPELCTSNIANRLGARCVNLHAPGIVSGPEIKSLFMREPSLMAQFELARSCSVVLFGATGLDAASTVISSGYVSAATVADYAAAGAVGMLSGRFLDAAGRPVLGALDGQMIGLELPEIARIPRRICIAGGPAKVEAIRAALRGGYATALVTDAATAQALLGAD